MIFSPKTPTEEKLTLLQKINPLNVQTEKEKFFFDQNYNPQFEYPQGISVDELLYYGKISEEYLPQARWVIDTVIKKYGTESLYLQTVEGPLLSREEATDRIREYLRENGLQERVQLAFSSKYIARSAIKRTDTGFTLQIRTPFEYREHSLEGTLNHEIGTHVFRWLNEMRQPWYTQHGRFQLRHHLRTEEGIAALHTNINREVPYIWLYALYYYAVIQAGKMSFSELFKDLRKYIDDKDRCWKICLRVKRGVSDTSLPLTFSKDQIYLTGLMEFKHWLEANDYDVKKMYMGKIDFADWAKIRHFYNELDLILPTFMQESKTYKQKIKYVYHFNHL